jgi:hypothetical protein
VSGPSPTSKWGVMLWGQRWGESGDGIFDVIKLIQDTLALSSDVTAINPNKLISNTLTFSSDMNLGTLTDGSGYTYVYPNAVTDLDSRSFASWTEATEQSTSYTEATEASTTWTDA